MIEFQDWHAFLRSVWGSQVSWNIPLIPRSRKCFMTVGTDIAPLRPICKVWEERAGRYQNQNGPRQHSVAFVSWVRKSPSHLQCSMKVSQQQLVGFSHMGNHLNGLYTWKKNMSSRLLLVVANHADSFGFMCWSFEISSCEISVTTPNTMEVTEILLVVFKVLKNYDWKNLNLFLERISRLPRIIHRPHSEEFSLELLSTEEMVPVQAAQWGLWIAQYNQDIVSERTHCCWYF